MPHNRIGIEDILEAMGLDHYCAWEMVKQTGGTLMTDTFWIRFNDNWTYRDHSLHGYFNFNPVNPFRPLSEHKEFIYYQTKIRLGIKIIVQCLIGCLDFLYIF